MPSFERLQAAREPEADKSAPVTWSDVYELLPPIEVTDADRLQLFAGDGEDDWEAPESVRRDKGLLLEWCRRYQKDMVLDDDSALIAAHNRTHLKLVHRFRRQDPRARVTPAAVLAFIQSEAK